MFKTALKKKKKQILVPWKQNIKKWRVTREFLQYSIILKQAYLFPVKSWMSLSAEGAYKTCFHVITLAFISLREVQHTWWACLLQSPNNSSYQVKGVRTLQSVEDSRASSRGHFRRARAFSNVTPPVLKMSQRLSGPAVRDVGVGVWERDSSGPHPASTVPGKKKTFHSCPLLPVLLWITTSRT